MKARAAEEAMAIRPLPLLPGGGAERGAATAEVGPVPRLLAPLGIADARTYVNVPDVFRVPAAGGFFFSVN